jgi:AcrR family transcriptional regulator
MISSTPPPKSGRPVDRSVVLDAALRIIDRDGVVAVTVRGLATEVGVSPMSLYRHFASKDHLYDLLLEHALQQLVPPAKQPSRSWRQRLEDTARHTRDVLLRHPNRMPLLTRVAVRDPSPRRFEQLLALVWPERVTSKRRLETILAVIGVTVGAVLVEQVAQGRFEIARRRRALAASAPLSSREPSVLLEPCGDFSAMTFDRIFDLALRPMISDEQIGFRRRQRPPSLRPRPPS